MQNLETIIKGTSCCDRCGKRIEDLTHVSIITKVYKKSYKSSIMVLCRKCLNDREMIKREADVLLCELYKNTISYQKIETILIVVMP